MGPEWESWRRSLDYYPEGDLIWLEVDTKIRQLTQGKRSLDDFCRSFHGGQSGPPMVVPYSFNDVVKGLNNVAAFDWAKLLHERVDATSSHAPVAGIEQGGWRLVYTDRLNRFIEAGEKLSDSVNLVYSLGFWLKKDGTLVDVVPDSVAYQAGIGPDMKLIAVNGRKWSREVLHDAIRTAQKDAQPIELIIENRQFIKTYSLAYHGGDKYPHLERVAGQSDVITPIVTAKVRESSTRAAH
jgi:predicted metalloprotease with PDZ domain